MRDCFDHKKVSTPTIRVKTASIFNFFIVVFFVILPSKLGILGKHFINMDLMIKSLNE